MIKFPLNPYTRTRTQTGIGSVVPRSNTTMAYSGTIANPWRVTSTTPVSGSRTNEIPVEMHDVVTPNWFRRKNSGEIINNPMESHTTVYGGGVATINRSRINRNGVSPNYYYTGSRTNGTIWVGNYSPTNSEWALPAILAINDESAIAEAITEAWAGVSLNEMQVLTQIAEAQKTYAFIVMTIKRAYKIIRDVYRLQFKSLMKQLNPRELKQLYLEARYALRPLMFDIKGTAEAITALREERLYRMTSRAYRYVYDEAASSDHALWNDAGLTAFYRGNFYSSRYVEVRSGVLADIESFETSVLGVTELCQSIWEIIPFSFIVDWFLNVGKWIASFSPKIGFKVRASWYTVVDTAHRSVTVTTGTNSGSWNFENYLNTSGSYFVDYVCKYRLPDPSRPSLPRFIWNVDEYKLLDLGAIISNFVNLSGKQARGLRL